MSKNTSWNDGYAKANGFPFINLECYPDDPNFEYGAGVCFISMFGCFNINELKLRYYIVLPLYDIGHGIQLSHNPQIKVSNILLSLVLLGDIDSHHMIFMG